MTVSPDYTLPDTSAMLRAQDEPDGLRLLIAQRKLYRRAKRWLGFRWFGMVVIGILAPVISVINQDAAVWAGAAAGLWLFLGRTFVVFLQSSLTARAAAVQEQFDFLVFGMPDSIDRSTLPSLEEISAIAGPDESLGAVATEEGLYGWYPLDGADPGAVSVAVSQRANASYANQLLKTTAIVWGVATSLWAVGLIAVSIIAQLSLLTFIAGVLLPLLPAFLDVVQYVAGIWRAAKDRGDLATTIEKRVREAGSSIDPQELLVWQERLYGLRRSTPEVPDFVYNIKRRVNERAMHSAARQLSGKAGRKE